MTPSYRLLPVADIVPHAPPMLALDTLLEWEPGRARVAMVVAPGPFVRNRQVDALLTLEYMAQAVAACLGNEAVLDGHGVRVGMVIACRQMHIRRPKLELGETLSLEVERVAGTDALSTFHTVTRDAAGREVATAQLTLVHGERPPEPRQP